MFYNSTENSSEQETACMTTCVDAYKNVTRRCCVHNDCASLPVSTLIPHIGRCPGKFAYNIISRVQIFPSSPGLSVNPFQTSPSFYVFSNTTLLKTLWGKGVIARIEQFLLFP